MDYNIQENQLKIKLYIIWRFKYILKWLNLKYS